jgi:hypothetical protein
MAWHARGQGFKSPQLHHRSPATRSRDAATRSGRRICQGHSGGRTRFDPSQRFGLCLLARARDSTKIRLVQVGLGEVGLAEIGTGGLGCSDSARDPSGSALVDEGIERRGVAGQGGQRASSPNRPFVVGFRLEGRRTARQGGYEAASTCRCGCWSMVETPSAAEQVTMPLTVAEPCDTAGYATLIVDTGSGRLPAGCWRGSEACRRTGRFRTVDLRLDRSQATHETSGAWCRPDAGGLAGSAPAPRPGRLHRFGWRSGGWAGQAVPQVRAGW